MIGIARALEIVQVARHAGRRGDVVIIVDMAVCALPWRNGVRAIQGEVHGVVVEGGRLPGNCAVALLASLREMRGHVVGVGRPLKILQMA